jgi:hypothetical protein
MRRSSSRRRPSGRSGAGRSSTTCRSSARSTSPSTSPARRWWAAAEDLLICSYSSLLRPSAAYGCSFSGVWTAFSTVSATLLSDAGCSRGGTPRLGCRGRPQSSRAAVDRAARVGPGRSGLVVDHADAHGVMAGLGGLRQRGLGFGSARGSSGAAPTAPRRDPSPCSARSAPRCRARSSAGASSVPRQACRRGCVRVGHVVLLRHDLHCSPPSAVTHGVDRRARGCCRCDVSSPP